MGLSPWARHLSALIADTLGESSRVHAVIDALFPPSDAHLVRVDSPLTSTGAPLEFAISDRDAVVRVTAEIPAPNAHTRLERTLEWLRAHGAPAPESARAWIRLLQEGEALRYGAWLGVRLEPGAHARYKLYAEVPAHTSVRLDLHLRAALGSLALWQHNPLRMVGIDCATHAREYYFRLAPHRAETDVPLLASRMPACPVSPWLSHTGRRSTGFSVAVSPAGDALAHAVFVPACDIFPTPEPLAGPAHGWSALASHEGRDHLRGMAAWIESSTGRTETRVGLVPLRDRARQERSDDPRHIGA